MNDLINYFSVSEKEFSSWDFNAKGIRVKLYEDCVFKNCNFENANLSDLEFQDCIFQDCNLSNVKLANTAFKEVDFIACKMMGLIFHDCNPFLLSFGFNKCQLNYSSFYKLNISATIFMYCELQEVDFTACNLSKSKFEESNLLGSVFDASDLKEADFRTAYNFIINPNNNKIQKAKFSINGLPGLLNQYPIEIEY